MKKSNISTIRDRFLSLIVAICVIFTSFPSDSFAQRGSAGFKLYSRGSFKNAINAYRKDLSKAKTNSKKSEFYKMIGICQYNIGQKSAAKISFNKAKSLYPRVSIKSSEVLDDSVISFFKASRQTARTPAPRPSSRSKAPNAKIAKSTKLQINSNATGATVLIDGIMAGSTGGPIEADPGKVQVTVSKKGYRSAVVNASIKRGRTNTFNVNLKKIIKKKPKPKSKKIARRKSKRQPTKKRRPRKRKNSDLFGEEKVTYRQPSRNIANEFDNDGTYQQPRYVAPQPQYQQPYQQPPYQQPQQPQYQQPQYQQPRYQQPQPVYAAPQYNPVPVAAPTPPPAASFDDSFSTPVKKKKRRKKKPRKINHFVSVLPFGAGQFQNGNTALGIVFAAAEAGALAYWFINYQEALDNVNATNAFVAQREEEEDEITDPTELQTHQDETDTFVLDSNAFVEGLNQSATIGIGSFAALWVIGVVEAFVNEPVSKKRRKKKKKRYPGFGLNLPIDEDEIVYQNLYNGQVLMTEKNEIDFQMHFIPIIKNTSRKQSAGLGVHLNLNF